MAYLKGALNNEIRRAMIGPITYPTYAAYVTALSTVGSELDGLRYNHNSWKRAAATPKPQRQQQTDSDIIDWEPTKISTLSTKERDRRLRIGACFSCGRIGHRARECLENAETVIKAQKARPLVQKEEEGDIFIKNDSGKE